MPRVHNTLSTSTPRAASLSRQPYVVCCNLAALVALWFTNTMVTALGRGFFAVGLLWALKAMATDIQTQSILSTQIAPPAWAAASNHAHATNRVRRRHPRRTGSLKRAAVTHKQSLPPIATPLLPQVHKQA